MNEVISLDEKRKQVELEKKELKLKAYLKHLKTNELQYEANDIISKLSNEPLNEESVFRGAVLMEEFAKRIDQRDMSNTVNKYASNLKDQLDSETFH